MLDVKHLARELKRRLGVLYASDGARFRSSDEGRSLYRFLTAKGRIGRRFSPRFGETESSLGRERELLIVVCRKWQVARRLVQRMRQLTDIPCIEYLFNEESCALPDLGGIQSTVAKRHRHRRALVRMLFDYYESERLVVCLDPSNLDLLEDFCRDRSVSRLLEIECRYSDAYLTGHAMRVGLAGDHTPHETLNRLLPTIRNDMVHESDRIRDAQFENHLLMREIDDPAQNARPIAAFLGVTEDTALELARTDNLFAD